MSPRCFLSPTVGPMGWSVSSSGVPKRLLMPSSSRFSSRISIQGIFSRGISASPQFGNLPPFGPSIRARPRTRSRA